MVKVLEALNADDSQNNGIILNDHPSGDYRISGNTVISGSGEFVFTGTGTFSIETNNTYTGGTTISAGELRLGAGGTTGSIIGDVLNNGILTFNRSDFSPLAE